MEEDRHEECNELRAPPRHDIDQEPPIHVGSNNERMMDDDSSLFSEITMNPAIYSQRLYPTNLRPENSREVDCDEMVQLTNTIKEEDGDDEPGIPEEQDSTPLLLSSSKSIPSVDADALEEDNLVKIQASACLDHGLGVQAADISVVSRRSSVKQSVEAKSNQDSAGVQDTAVAAMAFTGTLTNLEETAQTEDTASPPLDTPMSSLPAALRIGLAMPGAHSVSSPTPLGGGDIESQEQPPIAPPSRTPPTASGSVAMNEWINDLQNGSEFQFVQAHLVEEEEPSFNNSHFDPDGSVSNMKVGSAMESTAIFEAKPLANSNARMKWKLYLLLFLTVVVAVAIAVAVTLSVTNKEESSKEQDIVILPTTSTQPPLITQNNGTDTTTALPTVPPLPTLERIRKEGVLRCGLNNKGILDIFALEPGKENSFESDLGIAAAIMGREEYKIELITMAYSTRIDHLESGKIDVMIAGLSWTMDRDVYLPEPYDQTGLGFASVYSTLSSGFGGVPEYVACAQEGLKYLNECAGIKICTLNGTRFYDALAPEVPRNHLELVQTYSDFYPALKDGTCNVIASTFINLNFLSLEAHQKHDEFVSGEGFYSTEPLSLVTRKEDHQWTKFCKYIMLSLIAAEYHNITSSNVLSLHEENPGKEQVQFRRPTGFGEDYKDMFINAVAVAGNYGEMAQNRINPVMLPREAINAVNNGTTGIVHSLPFGQIVNAGPSFDARFEDVWNRGRVRCAIRTTDRPGFAERVGNSTESPSYSGMDVDYCLAIAASIFNTPDDSVEFVEVDDASDGFDLLERGEIDVLAGVMGDMDKDVKDPVTGVGFSFSTPYFYKGTADGAKVPDSNLCLATREDTSGWSEYVFWIVQATFYAEENAITRLSANEMPTVYLYGPRFTRIFRDALSAVGNYGDIYERNVQPYFPRQGMNMLQDKKNPSPLFYIPPGMIE